MATILEFRSEAQQPSVKAGRRRRRSAEIVIFPGVRYERNADAPPSARASASGVERDMLILVE
ncbi:MAG: hypothetical protein ACM31O_02800 [Bacteroidota bacterium]